MKPRASRARLVLCVAGLCIWMAGGACAAGPAATLRVATLNIAHGRGLASSKVWQKRSAFEAHLDAIAETLKREAPDVVALQEIDAPSAWSGRFDHVARLADASGYPYRHHELHFDAAVRKARIEYGTALLSRRPFAAPSSLNFDAKGVGSKGLATAEIQFDGNPRQEMIGAAPRGTLTSGYGRVWRSSAGILARMSAEIGIGSKDPLK